MAAITASMNDGGSCCGSSHHGHDGDESVLEGGFKRPIIVHRAMLGSLERMIAILTEHFGGKW